MIELSSYFGEKSFDTILCCEVLEHIPFEYFEKSLEEIKSLWSKRVHQPKYKVVFPEYFPPPYMFYVNTGRIYVFTWKEKNNSKELLVLDVKGNVQKKVFVPIADRDEAVCFSGDRYYYLKENPDKEMIELHMVEI